MDLRALFNQYPVPILVTTAFLLALGTTISYFAGLVPGVPKTLPTFVDLVMLTMALLVITVFSWTISLVVR